MNNIYIAHSAVIPGHEANSHPYWRHAIECLETCTNECCGRGVGRSRMVKERASQGFSSSFFDLLAVLGTFSIADTDRFIMIYHDLSDFIISQGLVELAFGKLGFSFAT